MTQTHSPLPWFSTGKFEIGPKSTDDDQSFGMVIAIADVFGDNKEADRSFILTAVNSYHQHIEDLDNAKAVIDQLSIEKAEHKALIKQMVDALSRGVIELDYHGGAASHAEIQIALAAISAAKAAGF